MKTKEFLVAVDAYLDGTATSWQRFIVDDHFDSFNHELDVLEFYRDYEVKEIYDRILNNIRKRIQMLD
jgi:hypothetical protein